MSGFHMRNPEASDDDWREAAAAQVAEARRRCRVQLATMPLASQIKDDDRREFGVPDEPADV